MRGHSITCTLTRGFHSVSQFTEGPGFSQPSVFRYLTLRRRCGLAQSTRERTSLDNSLDARSLIEAFDLFRAITQDR